MPSRLVRPETVTLQISEGDWLLVKKRLTHGEQQASFARLYLPTVDGQMKTNPLQVGMTQVLAYLIDWSLTDLDDKPLVIRGQPIEVVEDALNMLDPESFAEIRKAIDTHERAMAKARTDQKKMTRGASASSTTSTLPGVVVGNSTGSVS